MVTIEMSTDTATVCLFDMAALRHRKDDVGDWWSISRDACHEENLGNVLFFGLGEDGTYEVTVVLDESAIQGPFAFRAPSGRVFIGPGEETSAGGFEPDGKWGGAFVDLAPSNYRCRPERDGMSITLHLTAGGPGTNSLDAPIYL